jgi:hypothetical protein
MQGPLIFGPAGPHRPAELATVIPETHTTPNHTSRAPTQTIVDHRGGAPTLHSDQLPADSHPHPELRPTRTRPGQVTTTRTSTRAAHAPKPATSLTADRCPPTLEDGKTLSSGTRQIRHPHGPAVASEPPNAVPGVKVGVSPIMLDEGASVTSLGPSGSHIGCH